MFKIDRTLISSQIKADLNEKMVFVGGPRQVGKTTLAQSLLKQYKDQHKAYLNWDNVEHRNIILNQQWPKNEKLIIFDEIHKFSKWRNLVKGYFDTYKNTHQFLITGSARLDYYRKGGDSLLGRYHYRRLHPVSLAELNYHNLEVLIKFGGFPEPLIKQNQSFLGRWHRERRERVIYSDIRDLERVNEISLIDLLVQALPERVGSPFSRKSLAEDLSVDFKTIENWVKILERVYYCYRISPFGAPKIRAVKKEQKLYLWDWSEIENPGIRWENFIGSQLLKYCHAIEDETGAKMELRFLRDADLREVDFVVLKNNKALFAVECKTGEKNISKHIPYFEARTNIPKFYQVHAGQRYQRLGEKIELLSYVDFCKEVGLV